MHYTVTIAHAVPMDFLAGFVGRQGEDPPTTYYEAITLTTDATTPHGAAENAWIIGNVDGPEMLPDHLQHHADDVATYRQLRNRSVSVGDLAIIEGEHSRTVLQCAPIGWKERSDVVWTFHEESETVIHAIRNTLKIVPTKQGATTSAAHEARGVQSLRTWK